MTKCYSGADPSKDKPDAGHPRDDLWDGSVHGIQIPEVWKVVNGPHEGTYKEANADISLAIEAANLKRMDWKK